MSRYFAAVAKVASTFSNMPINAAMAEAQKRVEPPTLPLIGHGQQLADIRMNILAGANSVYYAKVIPQLPSRQVRRRAALKMLKAVISRENNARLRDRRLAKAKA